MDWFDVVGRGVFCSVAVFCFWLLLQWRERRARRRAELLLCSLRIRGASDCVLVMIEGEGRRLSAWVGCEQEAWAWAGAVSVAWSMQSGRDVRLEKE